VQTSFAKSAANRLTHSVEHLKFEVFAGCANFFGRLDNRRYGPKVMRGARELYAAPVFKT
jgi:hypothetical protein